MAPPQPLRAAALFACAALAHGQECQQRSRACYGPRSASEYVEQILLPSHYDKSLSPGDATCSNPVEMQVQFHLEKMEDVDQKLMVVVASGYYRQYWRDARLAYNGTDEGGCADVVQLASIAEMLWMPDLYVENLKSSDQKGAVSLRVHPNGDVLYSQFLTFSFHCELSFGMLPWDDHWCFLQVVSYSANNSLLQVRARGGNRELGFSGSGVEAGSTQHQVWDIMGKSKRGQWSVERTDDPPAPLPEHLKWTTPGHFSIRTYYGGQSYDVVRLWWHFERNPKYYLDKGLFPAIIFIFVSYTGFFVDPRAAPARAAIAIIPILTLNTLVNFVSATLPPLSGRIWLNDWLLVAMLLCSCSAAEFTLVQVYLSVEARREANWTKLRSFEKETRALIKEARRRDIELLDLLEELLGRKTWRPPPSVQQMQERLVRGNTSSAVVAPELESPEDEQPSLSRTVSEPKPAWGICVRSGDGNFKVLEADLAIIDWLGKEFFQLDAKEQDDDNELFPLGLRKLLNQCNVYVTTGECRTIMCMFLRDTGRGTPERQHDVKYTFEEALELLLDLDRYLHLQVQPWHPFTSGMPMSRRIDVGSQVLFPFIVAIFVALMQVCIHTYTSESAHPLHS